MEKKVYVTYIYDRSYTIEYGDYLLVFDYARGLLDIEESKNTVFFVGSRDKKSYTPEIFNIKDLRSLSYILNKDLADFKYEKNIIYLNKDELGMTALKKLYKKDNVSLIGPKEETKTKDLKVRTYRMGDKRLGFLIEISNIRIFYGGASDLSKVSDGDFLSLRKAFEETRPDLVFLPISPGANISYVDRLIKDGAPQIFFPTAIGSREDLSLDFKRSYSYPDTDLRSIKKPGQSVEIEVS